MEERLILVANPGSASRKYGLYTGGKPIAHFHFEHEGDAIVCTIANLRKQTRISISATDLNQSAGQLLPLIAKYAILPEGTHIDRIGLRVVAPTSYFLCDRVLDHPAISALESARERAPLHIDATLQEWHSLSRIFAGTKIVGVSDSAFHATKPDFAWNYGLPLKDADRLEIKRFGYHGISVASVVRRLKEMGKLPPKLIVCHLGSGASVTAVQDGKSLDTTMGYSPLEGLVMATRVGTFDVTAAHTLKNSLGLDDHQLEDYLNHQSGLLGLSGLSSDIRELLRHESKRNHQATLALSTYVHSVQKAVGQMSAVLGGVDMLVFTGTVGERSAPIRTRICKNFRYLELILNSETNEQTTGATKPTRISIAAHSKPIMIIPADEAAEIARHTALV